MREPWPLEAWPDVPTRFLLCRDDRLFPASFLRRVAHERLGLTADEIDGGHCVALNRPKELAARLEAYLGHQTPDKLRIPRPRIVASTDALPTRAA
jgi:pimeloyl-ACP methyl ester carboxylesterase